MTLRRRIATGILGILVLGIVSLAVALSYNSPCGAPEPVPEQAERMKAIVYRCYGSSEVLKVEDVSRPAIEDDHVLVRVRAAAVNPLDYHYMTGKPYIMRLSAGLGAPEDSRMGVDFAGTIEAVGEDVTRFKVGDEVFGGSNGALAEYLNVREGGSIALKPLNLTFEEAAAIPVAALTALQGLRDHGHIQAGQRVLINGASGGVGTFAVQIAKSYGAEVTGVCSTKNVEMVRSLGADHVIDYTKENFTEGEERYDLILDNVGNHSLSDARRVMKPDGILVIVGGPKENSWIGPLSRPLKAMLLSPFVSESFAKVFAQLNADDLAILRELAERGKLTVVIDRHHTLRDVPEAIEYLQTGRARGKVVIEIGNERDAALVDES